MVGYVMMFFGICDSIMAFISGPFQKYCGRRSLLSAGEISPDACTFKFSFFNPVGVFHLSLLVILLLWKPQPDEKILIFLILGALGLCDATWQTQACSKYPYIK